MKQYSNLRKYNPFYWLMVGLLAGLLYLSWSLGHVFYYLSKVIKAIGYFMLFDWSAAREQFRDFWTVYYPL